MAIDEAQVTDLKKTTLGTGLLKGLRITLRHLFSRSVTVQYPDVKPDLPARSRGVIALKEENCTVCMLCARECPDWCIYIEGHKEERRPKQEGKRAKKFNVLDRFAIDYALCMYCGICVEVCPYDALFWSPEFEYAEHDITDLTHEMEKLSDWMYTVMPPPPLEVGAEGPKFKTAVPPVGPIPRSPEGIGAAEGGGDRAASSTTPSSQPSDGGLSAAAPSAGDAPASSTAPSEGGPSPVADEARRATSVGPDLSPNQPSDGGLSAPEASAAAPAAGVSEEEAAKVRQEVLEAELAKGSDPRVAEARAKAAELRALKGTTGPNQN